MAILTLSPPKKGERRDSNRTNVCKAFPPTDKFVIRFSKKWELKKKSWFTLKISQLRLTPRISQLNQKPERRLLRALPNRLSSTKTTREPAEKSGSLIFDKTKKKPSFDH